MHRSIRLQALQSPTQAAHVSVLVHIHQVLDSVKLLAAEQHGGTQGGLGVVRAGRGGWWGDGSCCGGGGRASAAADDALCHCGARLEGHSHTGGCLFGQGVSGASCNGAKVGATHR